MHKVLMIVLAAALAVPALAIAAQPAQPGKSLATHGKSNPKVMYVLRGTVSGFTAASTGSDGALAIHVTAANYHARGLKGQDLAFTVKTSTAMKVGKDAALSPGDKVMVKFRDFKRTSNVLGLLTNDKLIRVVQLGS